MKIPYQVIDLETTIRNTDVGGNKGSPFHPDNYVVAIGYKRDCDEEPVLLYDKEGFNSAAFHSVVEKGHWLVGHNIKFDLHYMMQDPIIRDNIHRAKIWDTMVAEYILSGQTKMMPSLDYVSEKYGGTLKDDRIKEYWNNGVDTPDIPADQLLEYLSHDVTNTEMVFLAQLRRAHELGMLELLFTQMDACLCTIEMEFNGMHFDQDKAADLAFDVRMDMQELEERMYPLMEGMLPNAITDRVFNINSPKLQSLALFGGEYEYKKEIPMLDEDGVQVVYKSGLKKGQPRYKNTTVKDVWPGKLVPMEPKNDKGYYPTSDSVLKKHLKKASTNPLCVALIKDLLLYRRWKKDVGTYYEGYSKHHKKVLDQW